ncbi:MAG: tyrosine-type recombinase/integrase, partial [Candidatus Aenigmatarchaeota archaeon]
RKIEENGKPVISLRNTALLVFLWDTGARIGEALQTQLKHVEVKNGKVWVEVQGNKSSDDRKVRIFQGAQTLKDWYSNGHPVSTPAQRGEAYLFPVMWPKTDVSKPVGYRTVTKKIFKKAFRRLKKSGEVSCDISGEPNHIWRKAMTTFYRVNEWAGYDKILKRQGKSISNPTLPEYLRLM